jgi:hypothetical protein
MTDHIKTLRAIRSAFEGIPSPCDERAALDAAIAALRAQPCEPQGVTVDVREMKTSAGSDFYVCVSVGDRYLTPNMYREKWKADFDAAEWSSLLTGSPRPDILAYTPENTAPAGNVGGETGHWSADEIMEATAALRGETTPHPDEPVAVYHLRGYGDVSEEELLRLTKPAAPVAQSREVEAIMSRVVWDTGRGWLDCGSWDRLRALLAPPQEKAS